MIEKLFLMNGYGIFVWSAFGFTFLCLSVIYKIIKFELAKEQERFFIKFGNLSVDKIEIAKKQKTNKEILANIQNYNL